MNFTDTIIAEADKNYTEEISPTPQDMPQLTPVEEQPKPTQAMTYEQKYGQISQANRVAKWDDLKDNL